MALEYHGVRATEIGYSPSSPTPQAFTLPIYVGTAPVTLAESTTPAINIPILANIFDEAKFALGYSEDWKNYTLCEAMYSHFELYGQSPAVFINIMDPAKHKSPVAATNLPIVNGVATVTATGIVDGTIVVKSTDSSSTYTEDVDYVITVDSLGQTLIAIVSGGGIPAGTTALSVGYDMLDISKVTNAEVIGTYNSTTGVRTGLELIEEIFPRFQLVPNLLVANGFSHVPEIGKAMVSKVKSINTLFRARALTDLDPSKLYLDLIQWKNDNKYVDPYQINTYPKFKKDGRTYHASTLIAGTTCARDAANGGIPFQSPSNNPLMADSAVDGTGKPIFLPYDQANHLNRNGIVTGINFVGGFKAWGNRTAGFPGVTDPQQAFIPVARMFDWIMNTLITTHWPDADSPLTRRLIDYIVDKVNFWLNGLTGTAILGGRIEFWASDNLDKNFMDGIVKFRVFITPPSPAQEIDFAVSYDVEYLRALTQ